MLQIHVKLYEDILEKCNLGTRSIESGDIWIEFADGTPYPEQDWPDLPLSALSFFSATVGHIAHHKEHIDAIIFLDGPYNLKVLKVNDNGVMFLEDELRSDVTFECSFKEFAFAVKKALNKCIRQIEEKGYKTPHLEETKANLKYVHECMQTTRFKQLTET